MYKTTFKITKMDCPSEEQMIRMKLDGLLTIRSLSFDIPNRLLYVVHTEEDQQIFQRLETLKYDTSIVSTITMTDFEEGNNSNDERKALWTVLIINFLFFAIESVTGLLASSMGLVADSLDMLADSVVYGLALVAVGGTIARKKNIAKFAGYFQIILAAVGFIEIIRRFIGVEKMPDFQSMIIVSILALLANVACLYILQKRKSKEVHMQASMIFTSNDIIINAGVILAGLLVHWLNSGYPDLFIGSIVFAIVT
ncbi:MAG: cation transporter, partial [Pedobacter sp.]